MSFTCTPAAAKLAAMDVNVLRNWGIATSAALMAAALAVSTMGPASAPAYATQGLYEAAPTESARPIAAHVSFIVRFRGDGPIARAQALAARGREAQAGRQVEMQLEQQNAFSGLCFDRFTIGGAEIVLRLCEAAPASGRAAVQIRWLTRLNAMRAVECANANTAAAQEQAPK